MQALSRKKLVLFDLDGVLLDSKSNMELAWADVCSQCEVTTPFEIYFSNIGRPFKEILNIIGIFENQKIIEDVYNQSSFKRMGSAPFYPNVKDYLSFLLANQVKIGIVTSKSAERVSPVLKRLGIDFSVVKAPDDICRGKPAPDHLLMAMALVNVDPEDTVFIGDMDVDGMAAKRANIDYLHASWGYGHCGDEVIKLNDITDINKYLGGELK